MEYILIATGVGKGTVIYENNFWRRNKKGLGKWGREEEMKDPGEKKSRGENSGEVRKGMGEDKEKKSGSKWEGKKKERSKNKEDEKRN